MKQWSEIIRNVPMLSQLGLSLITPVLICLAVCWLIVSKTGAGGWVYIPGFFFGLGGSGTVAYKFYLSINRQQKKVTDKREGPKEMDIMRIVHLLIGVAAGVIIGYLIWGVKH